MSWTQTAATQAAKDAAAAATALEREVAVARQSGLADRVRAVFRSLPAREWSLQEVRTALNPGLGYPSLVQVNGAVWGLVRLGEVERTTDKKTGWGQGATSLYRRVVIDAVDEA